MRAALGFILALAVLLAMPARSFAQTVSVDGGYLDAGGKSSTGAALSLQLFKTPVIPLSLEATGLVSLDGNGYVASADARFRVSRTTLGAGVGIGNLGVTTRTNALYEGILAQSIFPHIAVEARYYSGQNRGGSIFAGLRFSF